MNGLRSAQIASQPSCPEVKESEMISKIFTQEQAMNMYKALREIAKGLGRYNRDPLLHASNTIEDMRDLAKAALEPIEKGERNGRD